MILEHVAIWTDNLETLKDFYVQYFDGLAGEKYTNITKQYESYFITFRSGARLELMTRPFLPENMNDTIGLQHKGIIHLAFEAATKKEVDEKALEFIANGFQILDGPRITGDGYYEFVTLDPDNNRIEITTHNTNN
jgi:lactoylglutathione lyase